MCGAWCDAKLDFARSTLVELASTCLLTEQFIALLFLPGLNQQIVQIVFIHSSAQTVISACDFFFLSPIRHHLVSFHTKSPVSFVTHHQGISDCTTQYIPVL